LRDIEWRDNCRFLVIYKGETPSDWKIRIWNQLTNYKNNNRLTDDKKQYLIARKIKYLWKGDLSYAVDVSIAICHSCNELVYSKIGRGMKRITAEYYRAGTPYLSPNALEEIIHSRETIKNASKEMARKYDTSTRRIYEIWKLHAQGLPLCKQQIIQNVGSSKAVPISKNNTLDRQTKKRRTKSVCMPDLSSDSKIQ
ncbi:19242_t:CDS:2, partial [Racocetra persica]